MAGIDRHLDCYPNVINPGIEMRRVLLYLRGRGQQEPPVHADDGSYVKGLGRNRRGTQEFAVARNSRQNGSPRGDTCVSENP